MKTFSIAALIASFSSMANKLSAMLRVQFNIIVNEISSIR